MNSKVRQILEQIAALEEELQRTVVTQEDKLRYSIRDSRVVFEQAVKSAHRRVKVGIFRWLMTVRPQNFFTMPFIYGMVVPLLLFDLCITLYQTICFPIYRIPRVRHRDYIVMDHQLLAYLNLIEKIDCMYCSYAVGMLAYSVEITARTEQYFCPIKHARKVLGSHSRYENFLNYGDEKDVHDKMEAFRQALEKEREPH